MHKLSNIRFNADKRDYAHLQIKRMLAAEYDYDTDIKPFENSLLNSVLPCTLLNVEFAGQTRCCSISRTSLSVLKMLGA